MNKILIVDDNIINCKILGMYMEKYGDCEFAQGGLTAVSKVKAHLANQCHYKLIMLDVMMPGMDGTEALFEIRKLEKEHSATVAKIVMVSANDNSQDIQNAFRNGCDAYITKPFNSSHIKKLIKNLDIATDNELHQQKAARSA